MHSKFTSSWALTFRTGFNLVCFICVLYFTGCRKEIVHEVGTETETFGQNSGGGGGGTPSSWTKITGNDISDVRTLCKFNNLLYVGGTFENTAGNIKYLAKIDAQSDFSAAFTGSFGRYGVYKLEVVSSQLMVGGGFSLLKNSNWYYNSFLLSTSGVITNVPYCSGFLEYISEINPYNSGVMLGGNFDPGASNNVSTSNLDYVIGSTGQGMGGTTETVRASAVFQGVCYIATEGGLYKWDGSNLLAVTYPSQYWSDEIYGLAVFNNNLYVLGKFNPNLALKKMSAAGNWSNVSTIGQVGSMNDYAGLTVTNGMMFIHCPNLQISGGALTSLIIYNGSSWSESNIPGQEVRDVEFYNGTYYAATNNGVYKKI